PCTLRLLGDGRPPQAEPISAVGTIGSASVSPSQPDQPPPRAALSWPENHVFRRRFLRSHPNFQLKILLRFSTKSIEHQRSSRLAGEPSKGRFSSDHLSAQDPPPGPPSFRTTKKRRILLWKILGLVKITGETLPKFRQKSKGILKKSCSKKGKKGHFCPTFARCRTRTGLGSDSKVEIGRVLSLKLF
ncbi:hypothetical protein Prudu_253S000500, partial [Prunus dulcis]